MNNKASDSLIQRTLVGSLAIMVFLLIDYFALVPGFQWVFATVLILIVGMSLWEFYEMSVAMDYSPMIRTGIWSAALYLLASLVSIQVPAWSFLPYAALFVLLVTAFALKLFNSGKDPLACLAVTFFGFCYIVLPLSLLLPITYYPWAIPEHDGRWWLLYLVLVTKMTDIGGFIIGKALGRHPLAPHISPRKTMEGALGGLLFSSLASLAIGIPALNFSAAEALILGAVISVAGQFGDLAESLLKRNAGIKDSSHLPGLGGLLDIMDSMIFTVPIVFLYLCVMAVK